MLVMSTVKFGPFDESKNINPTLAVLHVSDLGVAALRQITDGTRLTDIGGQLVTTWQGKERGLPPEICCEHGDWNTLGDIIKRLEARDYQIGWLTVKTARNPSPTHGTLFTIYTFSTLE